MFVSRVFTLDLQFRLFPVLMPLLFSMDKFFLCFIFRHPASISPAIAINELELCHRVNFSHFSSPPSLRSDLTLWCYFFTFHFLCHRHHTMLALRSWHFFSTTQQQSRSLLPIKIIMAYDDAIFFCCSRRHLFQAWMAGIGESHEREILLLDSLPASSPLFRPFNDMSLWDKLRNALR